MADKPRLCGWCPNRGKPKPGIIHMWGSVFVCRKCALRDGGLAGRRKVAVHDIKGDFSPANLKRLAASGIMDANALFLPAGKLSLAESAARERAAILEQESER